MLTRDYKGSAELADDINDFDLIDLAVQIIRYKFLIIGVAVAAAVLALLYLRGVTYSYSAQLSVTPAQAVGSGQRQLSGLAQLAGIDLNGAAGQPTFELYLEAIESRQVADILSRSPYIMHKAFYQSWDPSAQRWIPPSGSLYTTIRGVRSALGLPVYDWQPPDGAALHGYIKANITKSEANDSPMVTIGFRHPDRRFATAFLASLNRVADEQLRRSALRRSTSYVEYLSRQIGNVTVAEHRKALTDILSEQEKVRMIASADLPFAAEAFGEPTASPLPDAPRPLFVLAGALVAGALLGFVIAFMLVYRNYRQRLRAQRLVTQ